MIHQVYAPERPLNHEGREDRAKGARTVCLYTPVATMSNAEFRIRIVDDNLRHDRTLLARSATSNDGLATVFALSTVLASVVVRDR